MVPRRANRDWLFPGGELQPWLDALIAIDQRGDKYKSKLVELLKSDVTIPAEARHHLADLLERYQLKLQRGGKGGRRTPSYDWSDTIAQLMGANESVRQQMEAGKPLSDAFELATRVYGVNAETLHSYRDGKYASARRMKKRRPPVKNP